VDELSVHVSQVRHSYNASLYLARRISDFGWHMKRQWHLLVGVAMVLLIHPHVVSLVACGFPPPASSSYTASKHAHTHTHVTPQHAAGGLRRDARRAPGALRELRHHQPGHHSVRQAHREGQRFCVPRVCRQRSRGQRAAPQRLRLQGSSKVIAQAHSRIFLFDFTVTLAYISCTSFFVA